MLSVFMFALYIILIIVLKYAQTALETKILSKSKYSEIGDYKGEIFKYGVVSDLLAILCIILYSIIAFFVSYQFTEHLDYNIIYTILSIFTYFAYPFYYFYYDGGIFATLIPIAIIIVISIIFSFLFYFFRVFCKSEFPLQTRIKYSIISVLCTAPYYFLITFPIFGWMASS